MVFEELVKKQLREVTCISSRHIAFILIPPTPNNPWCVHRFASCAHPSEGILRSEFLTMAMKGCFVWIFLGKKVCMQTFYHGQYSLPTKTMGKLQLQSNHWLMFNRKFLQVIQRLRQFVQQLHNSSSHYTYCW